MTGPVVTVGTAGMFTPEETAKLSQYMSALGQLVSNLQTLEFMLRLSLQVRPNARSVGLPYGTSPFDAAVGTEVPECDVTSYDSLATLIRKHNDAVPAAPVDPTLVDVRDALAHGRVSGPPSGTEMRLVKYSKPANGKVRVEFNEILSEEWFKKQRERTRKAIEAIAATLPTS